MGIIGVGGFNPLVHVFNPYFVIYVDLRGSGPKFFWLNSHTAAEKKRINRSRRRSVADSGWPKEPCIRWVPHISRGEGETFGVVWPIENHVNHYSCVPGSTKINWYDSSRLAIVTLNFRHDQ